MKEIESILCHYKIECLFESIIKDRLILIFKDRWLIESSSEWKCNPAHGIILKQIYPGGKKEIAKYEKDDQLFFEKGRIDKLFYYYISKLLLESKYKKVNKNQIEKENKLIQTIHNYYNSKIKFDQNQDQLENFRNYLKGLKELTIKLDDLVRNSTKRKLPKMNIKDEIEFILETMQTDHDDDTSMNEVEMKCKQIRDSGNKEFLNGNFEKAVEYFNIALEFEGLSNLTKSILYSNLATTYHQSGILSDGSAFGKSCSDVCLLLKECCFKALQYRPSWFKPYYSLAKSFEAVHTQRYSSVENCILNSKVAEHLCLSLDERSRIKKFRITFENRYNEYESFKKSNHGKRNFKKEAESKLKELTSLFTGENNILKMLANTTTFTSKNYSDRHLELAKMLTKSNIAQKDYQLILYLYLKGSLSPINTDDNPILIDRTVISIYSELGRIYKNGLLGEPFDPEKATYYLELSIKNFIPFIDLRIHNTDNGSAYALLGTQYLNYYGKFDKAIELWGIGSRFGDSVCDASLRSYGTIFGQFDEKAMRINQENKSNKNVIKSSYLAMISRNYKEIDQEQSQHTLNFNEIKELSNQTKDSDFFIQSIYSTHFKVIKFTNLFGKLNVNKDSLNNKLEIIKPLADAFRDQRFYAIRLRNIELLEINNLVNQLHQQLPFNIDVAICWLGLNRFSIDPVKLLEYIEKLIKSTSGGGDTLKAQDDAILNYFKCLFIRYDADENRNHFNRFEDQFKLSNQFIRNNPGNNPLKDEFIYLSFSIVWYIDDIEKLFYNSKGLYEILIENSNQIIERYPKSNEQVAEIHFGIAYIKMKLGHSKKSILQSYHKGIDYTITIPEILSFRSNWLRSNLLLLKEHLSNHFNDNSFLNK